VESLEEEYHIMGHKKNNKKCDPPKIRVAKIVVPKEEGEQSGS
jgi:hypothetical protein